MKTLSQTSVFLIILAVLIGCSSSPKISETPVTSRDAKSWFALYCSKGIRPISGDLVIRSHTREFQGQYPANIRFEKTGGFTLEVTNILGGTMLRLVSNGKTIETTVPPKPQYNRKGITHYLGLDLPVLTQLLMGDLPCPSESQGGIKADGNRMIIQTSNWRWNFEKADENAAGVPARITLVPIGNADPVQHIELTIEDWDVAQGFAKKVTVKGPEGELHWVWRKRE